MNDEKFHNKYRIPSTRLATWDYGSNAAYFVTICTHDRRHAFGRVLGGQVELSPLGEAAWDCWRAIPDHFPFAIADAFVAMPNHVHGIVIIDKPADGVIAGTQNIATTDAGTQNIATTDVVETQDLASTPTPPATDVVRQPVRAAITKFGIHHTRVQNRCNEIRSPTPNPFCLARPLP